MEPIGLNREGWLKLASCSESICADLKVQEDLAGIASSEATPEVFSIPALGESAK